MPFGYFTNTIDAWKMSWANFPRLAVMMFIHTLLFAMIVLPAVYMVDEPVKIEGGYIDVSLVAALSMIGTFLLAVTASLSIMRLLTDTGAAPLEVLIDAVRRTPLTIALSLLAGAITSLAVLLLTIPAFIVNALTTIDDIGGLATPLTVPFIFVFFLWLTGAFGIAFLPVVATEDGGLSLLPRVLELTKGYRWQILTSYLIFLIISQIGVGAIMFIPSGILTFAVTGGSATALLFGLLVGLPIFYFSLGWAYAFGAVIYERLVELKG